MSFGDPHSPQPPAPVPHTAREGGGKTLEEESWKRIEEKENHRDRREVHVARCTTRDLRTTTHHHHRNNRKTLNHLPSSQN